MKPATELLGEVVLEKVGIVMANDAARSSLTVGAQNSLLALDADLNVLNAWPIDPLTRGWHASSPARGLALISGPSDVRLLDRSGSVMWSYQHTPWSGDFESGCTWFDGTGAPHAVVPAPSYDRCLVLRLDLKSGRPLATAPIEAAPAGISPIHHPDGWVGLSEGEGQDATRAWWIRSTDEGHGQVGIEVLDAGWDDWVLSDVDSTGTKIITTPHGAGPLLVRSFPNLEPQRQIDPPDDEHGWDYTACFAGDMVVNRLIGPHERLVAIGPDDVVHDIGDESGWLIPAAGDSWLAATQTTLRRWRMV